MKQLYIFNLFFAMEKRMGFEELQNLDCYTEYYSFLKIK